jgi:hypothetical protein
MRDASALPALPRWLARWSTTDRWVLALILGTACARLALSAATGMGIGESYYLASSRRLDLSYFDQPPLSLWLMHASLRLSGSEDATVLRLPFIALFGLTTWLMYRLGALLFGDRAGALAALLMNLSFVVSVSIGSWLQPDGPLAAAWLGAVLCLARLMLEPKPPRPALLWLAAGALLGLGMLAKYHAVFIVLGLGAYAATCREARARLTGAWPWAALALAGAMLLPVLWWNIENDFVSFRFQLGRGLPATTLQPDRMLFSIAGQALWLMPWIWAPLLWSLGRAIRRGPGDASAWFLACLAVGPIVVFTLVALWAPIGLHFHWQAPGYLMLFPLLGAAAARALQGAHAAAVRRWLGASAAAVAIAAAGVAVEAATGLAQRLSPALFADGGPAAELKDWRELQPALARLQLIDRPELFVVTSRWHVAGKIDRALAGRVPVLCLCADPRNIAFLHDHRRFTGHDAVIVAYRDFGRWAEAEFGRSFESIAPIGTVGIERWAAPAAELSLFLARGYRGNFPMGLTRKGAGAP